MVIIIEIFMGRWKGFSSEVLIKTKVDRVAPMGDPMYADSYGGVTPSGFCGMELVVKRFQFVSRIIRNW